MDRAQAGPFRSGVVKYGWMGPSPETGDPFLWAYQLSPADATDHEALLNDDNWFRIYSPGWYWLVGTQASDIQVVPANTEQVSEVNSAAEENRTYRQMLGAQQ